MLKINSQEAQTIFESLSQNYKIIAPVEKVGQGRFSDTNLITYDEVKSFEEIDFFRKTSFSVKLVLFPIRETLLKFKRNKIEEVKEKITPAILFLRACDIAAISVTDAHFLKSGFEDIYYKRRRDKLKFFLMECEKPFENCFCVSMGTNRTDNYSVFMRKTEDGYEVKVSDKDFNKYFVGGVKAEVEPKFVEKDSFPVRIPEEIPISLFEHEMWKEYSLRCSACGRCNTTCPTCTCFTMQDITSEDDKSAGERRRIWSSCMVKKFALLAGGYDFRIPYGDRLRYRLLHKIRDFKKSQGFQMCVGCGRCDDVCPEYISMFKCIEKINQLVASHG